MAKKPAPAPAPWPAANVSMWPVGKLQPFERNPRVHSETQVEQIVASMKEFGWTMPILAAEDGTIIAGHGRLLAAGRLGYAEVPVMVAQGWSEAQRRAYVLADNKLTENSAWDHDLLAGELEWLKDTPLASFTGFNGSEIEAILSGWTSDISVVERHGEHTDGILVTIKVKVPQEKADDASAAIKEALATAGIAADVS